MCKKKLLNSDGDVCKPQAGKYQNGQHREVTRKCLIQVLEFLEFQLRCQVCVKGAVGGQVDSDSEVPSAVVALHCEGIDDLMCF